jgi:hypothetical protein
VLGRGIKQDKEIKTPKDASYGQCLRKTNLRRGKLSVYLDGGRERTIEVEAKVD